MILPYVRYLDSQLHTGEKQNDRFPGVGGKEQCEDSKRHIHILKISQSSKFSVM